MSSPQTSGSLVASKSQVLANAPAPNNVDPEHTVLQSKGCLNLNATDTSGSVFAGWSGLPVEIRWQILKPLVVVNDSKFCPHVRQPLHVIGARHGSRIELAIDSKCATDYQSYLSQGMQRTFQPPGGYLGANGLSLGNLHLNRSFYQEAIELFYRENIFYLEDFLHSTPYYSSPASIDNPLVPLNLALVPQKYRPLVTRIGFAVNDQSIPDFQFHRWSNLCSWIKQCLPNLKYTYIYLFGPGVPTERFLVKMVNFLHTIPGKKSIEFRGSNNAKKMIGKVLRFPVEAQKDPSKFIDVLGGCFCKCWIDFRYNVSHPYHDRNQLSACAGTLSDWLRNWDDHKAVNALGGSIMPGFCSSHRGAIIGCLLCHKRKKCSHDTRFRPGKLVSDGDPGEVWYG